MRPLSTGGCTKEFFFAVLLKHGHKRWVAYPALVVGAVLALLLLVYSIKVPIEIASAVSAALLLAGLLSYEHFVRPRKITAGRVGMILAITGETNDDELRVANDFTKTFCRELERSNLADHFQVIVLPKFLAHQVTTLELAAKMMYKCQGHFLAFGDVRKRREGGKEFHALRLQCLVRHTPISVDTQTQLSQEMSESLPLNVAINCESDLSGFEITSSQFASGAKFIIATAAMLSQDVGLAKSILEELYRDLPMIKKQGLSLGSGRLAELVSARLVDCLKVISLRHHTVWRTSRDPDELMHGLYAAEAGLRIDDSATEFHNARAIAAFVLDHSVSRARQNLMVCAKLSPKDPSWRYGLAFLAAHDGDLNTAWHHYRDAFGKDVVDALPNEIEEFISWVLSKEPGKIQLHYCLGILNFKRKVDKVQANADFAEFLRRCPADKFVEAQQRARRYIERT